MKWSELRVGDVMLDTDSDDDYVIVAMDERSVTWLRLRTGKVIKDPIDTLEDHPISDWRVCRDGEVT